jgi:hypothetical protein
MTRLSGAARWLTAAVVLAIATPACGPDAPPPPPPKKETGAHWPDVFDGTPDIFVVIRPQAIKRDAVYGTFWKNLIRVAQSKNFAGGASMLEAAEGAEEIIVGINRGLDAALVLRGVPANLDPVKMNDPAGHPVFRLADEKAKVHEYQIVDRRDADPGSVFVLQDRTWVGAIGDARVRARQAFASPMGRPSPKVAEDALAFVRFGQPVVTSAFFQKHPTYGAFTKKLLSVTFTLKPGKGGVVLSLLYDDQDAAAWSEMHAKQLVQELAKEEKRYGWLKDAKVAYEGNALVVKVAVPPRLLEELPNASGADFGF